MRVLILALSVLAIFVGADAGKAGPSTATRDDVLADDVSASVEPANLTDEATQETEDRIGLDKRKRRDVQRGLTRLGFDTKANGKFDQPTRASSFAGRRHGAIPGRASSTRCSIRRCSPRSPRWRGPASAAATNPTRRPVVAVGVALATTAVAAADPVA